MTVNICGLDINYKTCGDAGRPDILMLHGWGASMEPFDFLIKHLSQSFRVTAFDFPGCGGSRIMGEPWDVEDYAELTVKLIDKLGLKNPVLIGHSNGGRVIMQLCGTGMLSPEKIVLFGAAGIKHKKTLRQRLRQAAFKTIKRVLLLPGIKKHSAGLLERARAHFGSADYRSAPEVLRQTMVRLLARDMRPLLPGIKASTLLIYGENDTATPVSDAEEIAGFIKDSGVCVIKGAGHFCFLDSPYETAAILDAFLKEDAHD